MKHKKIVGMFAILFIVLSCGIVIAADSQSNIFLNGLGFGWIKNYLDINGTNANFNGTVSVQNFSIRSAPSACPANTKMTYFNGTNSICVADNLTGSGSVNQLALFTAAGVLGNSQITFDGANMTIGAQSYSLFTVENVSGNSQISTNYTRFSFAQNITAPGISGAIHCSNITGEVSDACTTNISQYLKSDGSTAGTNTQNFSNIRVTGNSTFDGGTMTIDGANNIITIPASSRFQHNLGVQMNWIRNGSYYTQQRQSGYTGNGTMTANFRRCEPFITGGRVFTFDQLGLETSVANGVAVSVAVYNDSGNIYPGSLIVNSTPMTAASVAMQLTTISPISLKENSLYWVCSWSNATANVWTGPDRGTDLILGKALNSATNVCMGWLESATYVAGGWNSTFDTDATCLSSVGALVDLRARTDVTGTIVG